MELCQLSSFSDFQSKRGAAKKKIINSNKGGDQVQFVKVSVASFSVAKLCGEGGRGVNCIARDVYQTSQTRG